MCSSPAMNLLEAAGWQASKQMSQPASQPWLKLSLYLNIIYSSYLVDVVVVAIWLRQLIQFHYWHMIGTANQSNPFDLFHWKRQHLYYNLSAYLCIAYYSMCVCIIPLISITRLKLQSNWRPAQARLIICDHLSLEIASCVPYARTLEHSGKFSLAWFIGQRASISSLRLVCPV